jgi:hypothetical protein
MNAEAPAVMDDTTATEGQSSTKKPTKKAVAPKPAKATKPETKEDGILTLTQATSKALKDNVSVDIGRIFVMPIGNIYRYDNPRHEPEALYAQGYTLIGDPRVLEASETDYVSLVHLALSDDMEHVRQYAELIEEFEGPVMRLLNPQGKVVHTGTEAACKAKLKLQADRSGWKIDDHPSAPQSIYELAQDIYLYSQLDPIEIREHGKKIHVIDGGRRIAAILYLHAKSKVLRADKAECADIFGEGTPKEFPALVQATELKASGDDFVLACQINLSRKMFTPLQEGRVYHEMLEKTNPATGKFYTMKDAAAALGVEYGTFRNREALWRDPEFDDEGKLTKGLTESERRKIALGEMLVTHASRKALGEHHYSETGTPAHNRNRGLPLSKMQELFDATPSPDTVRRQAIADCMGLSLKDAIAESDKRIEEADRRSAQEHEKNKNKKKEKAA